MNVEQEISPQNGSISLIATNNNLSDIDKFFINVINSFFISTGCKYGSYYEYELKHNLPLIDENNCLRIELTQGCFYVNEKYSLLETYQERIQAILCTFEPPKIIITDENIDQFFKPIKNENNQNITMQELGNYIIKFKLLTDEGLSQEIQELLNKEKGGIQDKEILEISTSFITNREYPYCEVSKKVYQSFERVIECPQLKGIVEIATKDGNSLILATQPQYCYNFFMLGKGANSEYLETLRTVVKQILEQSINKNLVDEYGIVWISTNKIIKEITRTEYGINQRIKKDEHAKKMCNLAMKIFQNSTLEITNRKYEHFENESLLVIKGYRNDIIDKRGNLIKDVWGVSIATLDTYINAQISKGTKKRELLKCSPLQHGREWEAQYINGNLLSICHTCLYPQRGKGKTTHRLKVKWDSIYLKAEPTKNPSKKVKERIKRNFIETLEASILRCEQEAQPMYISYTTNKDYLDITALKKPIKK